MKTSAGVYLIGFCSLGNWGSAELRLEKTTPYEQFTVMVNAAVKMQMQIEQPYVITSINKLAKKRLFIV